MAQALSTREEALYNEIEKKEKRIKKLRDDQKNPLRKVGSALTTLGTIAAAQVASRKVDVIGKNQTAVFLIGGGALMLSSLALKKAPAFLHDVGVGLLAHPAADLGETLANKF